MRNNAQKNRFQMLFTDELYNLQSDIFKVNLPGISLSSFEVTGYGGITYKQSGDTYDYGQLRITLRLYDDLSNMEKFQDWMHELLDPETGDSNEKSIQGTLQIYGSSGKVIKEVDFQNLRPVDIVEIDFESNTTEVDFELFEVTFDLDRWNFRKK